MSIDKDYEFLMEKNKLEDTLKLLDAETLNYIAARKQITEYIIDARKKAIKARLKTYSIDDFKNLFEIAEKSDFLKGNNDRNWNATFDWLIKDSNMAKVLDGNYNNKGGEINDIRRKDKKVVERELDENEREINRIFGIE